jgi:hypothetical protein
MKMAMSSSPTVSRRQLAAELHWLRGDRIGDEVAQGMGWSPAKISRIESGSRSLPPTDVKKLIDFYGVTEPARGRLLELASEAAQRGWWEDWEDALTSGYMDFIGLEAEASPYPQWHPDGIPGFLQTEDYTRPINVTPQHMNSTIPPGTQKASWQVGMPDPRMTRKSAPELSVVLDEVLLLRRVGDRVVMRAQLIRLADLAEPPNVGLQILPLDRKSSLRWDSFVITRFSPDAAQRGWWEDYACALTSEFRDLVSTEALDTRFTSVHQ